MRTARSDGLLFDGMLIAADTTIKISSDDWQAMAGSQLDRMTGKLKVDGDMGNAMQLQGVFAKLRG